MTAPNQILDRVARSISTGEYQACDAVMLAVDAKGRAMDERWGIGRLPSLVPCELADRFQRQSDKFRAALEVWDYPNVLKHGQAMERAYAHLDQVATEAGGEPIPPEQWEFDTPEGLVVLVRDMRQTNQVQLHGRQAQVWSLDEIANVIRAHPVLAKAKEVNPGAQMAPIRPVKVFKAELNDALDGLPF